MHAEVEAFLTGPDCAAGWWEGARVIEVGAQDVNGAARRIIPDYCTSWVTEWVGVDLIDGPGVDYVGDAAAVLRTLCDDGERFDVALSCEVMEHAANWRAIVDAMLCVLKPGGHMVITCAAPGRPPHGASGAPQPAPGEWYENVSLAGLVEACGSLAVIRYGWQRSSWPQDTYLIAERTDY